MRLTKSIVIEDFELLKMNDINPLFIPKSLNCILNFTGLNYPLTFYFAA